MTQRAAFPLSSYRRCASADFAVAAADLAAAVRFDSGEGEGEGECSAREASSPASGENG